MQERLHKVIARAGRASRREAERLISEGRVQVNSSTVTELGTKVDPAHDMIWVDGKKLTADPPFLYILLNKPAGYVGVFLYGTYPNWVASCLAAAWATNRRTPLAGAGYGAAPWKEAVVQVLQVSLALAILAGSVLVVYALR